MRENVLFQKLIAREYRLNSIGRVLLPSTLDEHMESKRLGERVKIHINFYFEHGLFNNFFVEMLFLFVIFGQLAITFSRFSSKTISNYHFFGIITLELIMILVFTLRVWSCRVIHQKRKEFFYRFVVVMEMLILLMGVAQILAEGLDLSMKDALLQYVCVFRAFRFYTYKKGDIILFMKWRRNFRSLFLIILIILGAGLCNLIFLFKQKPKDELFEDYLTKNLQSQQFFISALGSHYLPRDRFALITTIIILNFIVFLIYQLLLKDSSKKKNETIDDDFELFYKKNLKGTFATKDSFNNIHISKQLKRKMIKRETHLRKFWFVKQKELLEEAVRTLNFDMRNIKMDLTKTSNEHWYATLGNIESSMRVRFVSEEQKQKEQHYERIKMMKSDFVQTHKLMHSLRAPRLRSHSFDNPNPLLSALVGSEAKKVKRHQRFRIGKIMDTLDLKELESIIELNLAWEGFI